MELFAQLGIDWRLFTAQAVNFVVLLIVLNRVLYRPFLRMLDARTERIKKGIALTEEMEHEHARIATERDEVIRSARAEAERIISEAMMHAEEDRARMIEQARMDAKRIVEEGGALVREQHRVMLEQVRGEIAALTVDATKRVLTDLGIDAPDATALSRAVAALKDKKKS